MMMRSIQPCMLTAGGLYPMNLESYGNVCIALLISKFLKSFDFQFNLITL